eukprot:2294313-Amphidinium_carterae.1
MSGVKAHLLKFCEDLRKTYDKHSSQWSSVWAAEVQDATSEDKRELATGEAMTDNAYGDAC